LAEIDDKKDCSIVQARINDSIAELYLKGLKKFDPAKVLALLDNFERVSVDLKRKLQLIISNRSFPQNSPRCFYPGITKIDLPIRCRVAVIDPSNDAILQLSNDQYKNVGLENGKALIEFQGRSCQAEIMEIYDDYSNDPEDVRITEPLAYELGCKVGSIIIIADAIKYLRPRRIDLDDFLSGGDDFDL
jgi:hypothetical protein